MDTAKNDLDRLVAFYAEVFELTPLSGFPMDTPLSRIASILLQHDLRLDHFTFRVDSPEAFRAAKDYLVRLRASDGNVIDFQGNDLLAFTDPDGHVMEIIHRSDAS